MTRATRERDAVSPTHLRALLNRSLQEATGKSDLVFTGPIRHVHGRGPRGCNWSAHLLRPPIDFEATARPILQQAMDNYDLA
jgi:hypothetical protein